MTQPAYSGLRIEAVPRLHGAGTPQRGIPTSPGLKGHLFGTESKSAGRTRSRTARDNYRAGSPTRNRAFPGAELELRPDHPDTFLPFPGPLLPCTTRRSNVRSRRNIRRPETTIREAPDACGRRRAIRYASP